MIIIIIIIIIIITKLIIQDHGPAVLAVSEFDSDERQQTTTYMHAHIHALNSMG